MRKTLEGGRPWRERAPLSRGALSLQTSLSPENFPQEHPPLYGENLFRYVWAGALGESFFCFWGGIFLQSAASHPFCYGDALRDIPYVDSALAKRFQKKRNDTWVVPYKHFFRYCHNPVSRSAPFKKSAPPAQTKTSPQDPHPQKGETKLRSSHGGGLVGKFGEVEGGLEGEGTTLRKGVPSPSKVFPSPTSSKTAPERNGRGGRGARGERK